MNGKPVLRRELLDQLAHFPVADDREFRSSLLFERSRFKRSMIWSSKELLVERFYRATKIGCGHHHTQIQLRRSLRHHPRPDAVQRRERTSGDVVAAADVFT